MTTPTPSFDPDRLEYQAADLARQLVRWWDDDLARQLDELFASARRHQEDFDDFD